MKGIGLATVLLGILTIFLGYLASSGFGMQAPDFQPRLIPSQTMRSQQIAPEVSSVKAPAETKNIVAISPPEVKVERRRAPRYSPAKIVAKKVDVPQVVVTDLVLSKPTAKPAITTKKKPRVLPTHPTISEKTIATDQPVVMRDETSSKNNKAEDEITRNREWRKSVLERWRKESEVNGNDDISGMEPAQNVDRKSNRDDKPPQKKKRHGFLFIRW